MRRNKRLTKDSHPNDLLSLKNDFVFKLVFGNEKNKDVLVDFLSAVIKIPLEMSSFIKKMMKQ